MLHEFALDPETFKDLKDARYLAENFGFEHGRLISRFPKAWRSMAYESCKDCLPAEKKRIEIILGRKDWSNKLTASNRIYNSENSWLSNAKAQQNVNAFRAVITSTEQMGDAFVTVDQLNHELEKWRVPRGVVVKRTVEDLSKSLYPILSTHKEILFVDPYFDASNRRWNDVFIEYLHCIYSKTRSIRRVELHLDATPRPNKARQAPSTEEFCRALNQKYNGHPSFSACLPRGSEMTLVRWREKPFGERLHDRFVLTESGGVSVPGGLDPGKSGHTTDMFLLDPSIYIRRWNNFQVEESGFRPLHSGDVFQPVFDLADLVMIRNGQAKIVNPKPTG